MFLVTETRREFSVPIDIGIPHIVRAIPLFRALSMGTVAYMLAVLVSLITLSVVTPGPAPVGLAVEVAMFFAIGLLGAGIAALVVFILAPRRWVENPRTVEARKEWIERMNRRGY